MTDRSAEAVWDGSLREGKGTMKLENGRFEGPYSYASRFEDGQGTNPEELIAAAHAGCFSMSLSSNLGKAGFTPRHIQTRATVTLDKVDGKNKITGIHLDTEAQVPEISKDQFLQIAEYARANCPVSVALASVENISLTARLI